MQKTEIAELAGAYGWVPIESRNRFMLSFRREESRTRMNFYFTTGTVTFDTYEGQHDSRRDVVSAEEFENVLIEKKNS